jgi:hypothetical protein
MTTKIDKLIFVREENEAEYEVVRATGSSRKKEEEKEMNDSDDDETLFLCFCVPGNPGVPEFYSNFTRALREVRPFESGGREEEETEGERVRVFSGGALDRCARSAARVERDAFGGGDEDGWIDAVFARKREIECAEVPRVVGEPTRGRARGGESSRVYAKV